MSQAPGNSQRKQEAVCQGGGGVWMEEFISHTQEAWCESRQIVSDTSFHSKGPLPLPLHPQDSQVPRKNSGEDCIQQTEYISRNNWLSYF